ncbi:MFS transporter [Aquibacillus kalidii]|uniref:hypothetical protein n=1 Tax=Aquibacillus kalidii TaxID=2762597 RepID=UPI0016491C5E|nr:hypothetical protein [Aquibacillus kalidii]
MKKLRSKLKVIALKFLQGLVEYIVLFPIFLWLAVYFVPDQTLVIWLSSIAIIFLIVIAFRVIFLNQPRWIPILFGLAVVGVFTYLFQETWLELAASCLVSLVVAYRALLYAENEWGRLFSSVYMWSLGIPVYFIGYFLFKYVDKLVPYQSPVTVLGVVLLILALFISNDQHLATATLSKKEQPRVSSEIKRNNRVFLIVTILVIGVITNFQVIQHALFVAVKSVAQGVIGFLTLFESEPEPLETPKQQAQQPLMMQPEEYDPSLFAILMEKLMILTGYLAIVVFIFLLLAVFVKRFRGWLITAYRFVRGLFKQVFSRGNKTETENEYVDEKESSFDWNLWRKQGQEKVKNMFGRIYKRPVKFDNLSSREKVRFIYKHLIKEHSKSGSKLSLSATAHEMIRQLEQEYPDRQALLAELELEYDRVRYGDKDGEKTIIDRIAGLINK